WQKLGQPVRPVAGDDAADFGIDLSNVVEAFLDLLADHLQIFRAERAAVQEFHWHSFAPPRCRWHGVQPDEHRTRRRAWTPRTPKADHKAAPTTAARVKKTLANPEPSTHGPSRRTTLRRPTVAFGALRTWTDFRRATICSE